MADGPLEPSADDVLRTVSPWKTRGATTWVAHRVLRRTARFVFVLDVLRRATLRLDREALERDGRAYSRSRARTYYSAEAKERREGERRRGAEGTAAEGHRSP